MSETQAPEPETAPRRGAPATVAGGEELERPSISPRTPCARCARASSARCGCCIALALIWIFFQIRVEDGIFLDRRRT